MLGTMRPFCAGLPFLVCLLFVSPLTVRANPPYPAHFTYTAGQAFGFIGDESVYDGRWCQYVENFFYTRYPDRKMVFYNAGVKADTAHDVLERLDADIIERKLDYAIIQLGTWDAGLGSFDPAKARAFQLNVAELLNRLEDAKIHPFLMSPSLVDLRTHRERTATDSSYRFRLSNLSPDYNGVMGYYTALLGDLAMERRVRFVDAWGALTAATARERRVNPAFSLVPEGLLPDAGGHAVMAVAVIDVLSPEGAEREADILLMHGTGDPAWRSKATGGTLSQLSGSDSQVSFIWLAKSLPWAMPEDAFIGSQLAGVDESFNRERLQAIGLKEGKYELWIAGELMQIYTSDQLSRGIDIHTLWNRPEYRRAQAVANLNVKRYADTVRPMRDLWQQVKEVRVNYPADDARQQQILTQVTPKLNALRNAAREQADAIYEAAKPLARNYELRRVLTPEEQKAAAAAAPK
jgi:lysophospholipase L1-like esterase